MKPEMSYCRWLSRHLNWSSSQPIVWSDNSFVIGVLVDNFVVKESQNINHVAILNLARWEVSCSAGLTESFVTVNACVNRFPFYTFNALKHAYKNSPNGVSANSANAMDSGPAAWLKTAFSDKKRHHPVNVIAVESVGNSISKFNSCCIWNIIHKKIFSALAANKKHWQLVKKNCPFS